MPSFNIISFINANQNYVLFGVALVGVFIVYELFKGGGKEKPKIISRSDLEKRRRIEELKYNKRTFPIKVKIGDKEDTLLPVIKTIWHGDKCLGNVLGISERILKAGNPATEIFYEIVFKPLWFGRFTNPFSKKKEIIRIAKTSFETPSNGKEGFIDIKEEVSLDAHMGVFYDVPNEEKHLNWITDELYKHDKEANASFYEVESQKRATFDINLAGELDKKEKEIQAELARKKGFAERV